MKPLKLTMQAFGSYGKKTVIDFTEPNQNLFLITGDTGSGKTTIFDAIVFALYGEASSGMNRKDGTELQSQYMDYEVPPFVELIFQENEGGEEALYTVRRVPRHIRPLKKGTGVKEEKETVSLLMPDGSEYSQNQKETDKKLEEIVGLTKEQFMQVVMIAQGEFMELLRAKSDSKKMIFRKLFHTEQFQRIVEELGQRKKNKASEITQIRMACQAEVGHVTVPETEQTEQILELKRRILLSERLSVTDMEALLETLKAFCDRMEEKKEIFQKDWEKAGRERDEKRDACTEALSLLRAYEQLEKAGRELAECEEQKEKREKAERLSRKIRESYELKTLYDRLLDAERETEDTKKKLKEQQEALPGRNERLEKEEVREKVLKEQRDRALQTCTQVSERVTKALETLGKIEEAQKAFEKKQSEVRETEENAGAAKKTLKDFEEQVQQWRGQEEELKDAELLLERFQRRQEEAEKLAEELDSLRSMQKSMEEQKRRVEKTQKLYGQARDRFAEGNAEYVHMQTAFLDAQAGFLAREKLMPGQPCPVCGSLEHPAPAVLKEEHQTLTRGELDDAAKEVAKLQQEQTKRSAEAAAAVQLLEEKKGNVCDTKNRLWSRMEKAGIHISSEALPEEAEKIMDQWREELKQEGRNIVERARLLADVRKSLKNAEDRKERLKGASEAAERKYVEAKTALAQCRTLLESLKEQRDYPSREDAEKALQEAQEIKRSQDNAYRAAYHATLEAKTEKERGEALIAEYQRELPGRCEELQKRRKEYEALLKEKMQSEPEWKGMTEQYERSDAEKLQERIREYDRKKAASKGAYEAAEKTIRGRVKPDLESLQADRNAAEERLQNLQTELDQVKEWLRINDNVYCALMPKMEERSRITREYTRLDSLHNRLAGKVSGARMDIETFVQRYYLQRILYAANLRFQEMSAGQFELRLIGEEEAGEGKNRGLDLMVYSTVTGREREVRTLSGGESFMAALSLALGMADQIRESSASVNLDVMFIDEGFGSLDDHARNQAVKVLRQMADGSRMIGIISHVTELKQEMEDHLLVTKDENGSHVRWQIS